AISEKELDDLIFEVSVLSKPALIQVENTESSLSNIVIGRDGIILESRYGSGLFLPQVPVEQKWNIREYITNLCHKAGAPSDAWLLPDSKLYTFSSLIFREKLPNREIYPEST
ncbi:MAG TPA: TIGR00296 family protein, partial [Nitrososphaeraceae archaeon]